MVKQKKASRNAFRKHLEITDPSTYEGFKDEGFKDEGLQDNVPAQELLHALESMHRDPKYSDLTIVCGTEEYSVHKCIVCTRSGFFANACNGGFKESSTNRVVLQEEPVLVKQMIAYFYSLDYQVDNWPLPKFDRDPPAETPTLEASASETTFAENCSQHPDGGIDQASPGRSDEPVQDSVTSFDSVSFHILMYSLADRMLIDGLKALSNEKVERELAQRLDANTFPHAIVEIYNSTPANDRGLRDLAVRMTMDCLSELRTVDENAQLPFPDSLVESVPQFSSDLLVTMMNRTVSDWNQYGACNKNWDQKGNRAGTQHGLYDHLEY